MKISAQRFIRSSTQRSCEILQPKFDMLDPDDYAFTHYFAKIQKRFPSLRWDDVIRKGLEEWMMLAKKDEEAENESN